MTQIAAYIKDPAWWFSAFFIAIVASVLASFAKDYIQTWMGSFSVRARIRQEKMAELREQALSALETNEGFLILSMLRSVALLVLMMSTIILFVLSPMWSEVFFAFCRTLPVNPECSRDHMGLLSVFAAGGFGSLAVFASLKAMPVMRITMQGFRRYRRKRNLPVLK